LYIVGEREMGERGRYIGGERGEDESDRGREEGREREREEERKEKILDT
jgi:hypothetical protein